MAEKNGDILKPILVAVVIALIAGGSAPWWWGKLFPTEHPPNANTAPPYSTAAPTIQSSQPSGTQKVSTSTPPEATQRPDQTAEVERLVAKWLAAWMNGRTDEFVSLAGEPFYFDQKVILSRPELRSEYEKLRQQKGDRWRELEIQSIKVRTARELQASGYDLSRDRIFSNLSLTLDDYTATVMIKQGEGSEGMIIVVRRVGDHFEIAGVWD